jgi:hypothetical protein
VLLNVADFGDIASTVAAASDGDRIYIPGYRRWAAPAGGIQVTKSLEIFGDGPGDPGIRLGSVVEPAALGEDVFVIHPAEGSDPVGPVYLHDLMIAGREGGPARDGRYGIRISGAEAVRLDRVTIINMSGTGVEVNGATQVVMTNVFPSHCEDAGTRLASVDLALLTSCFWGDDLGSGLDAYGSGCVILSSNFESNRPAPKVSYGSLRLESCPIAVVSGCRFEDPSPPPSTIDTAVFDGFRSRMVVVNAANEVWAVEYSGGGVPSWSQLSQPGDRPNPRMQAAAIFRPGAGPNGQGQVVVFGGKNLLGGYFDDTWAFDLEQAAWAQLATSAPPDRPAPRAGHSAILDPVGNRVIVFGGMLADDPVPVMTNDVWSLSLSDGAWTQLAPTGQPPSPRWRHGAVYDATQERMIVFGGEEVDETLRNDLWALSLSGGTPAWSELSPTGSVPAARHSHVAVIQGQGMLLHGGVGELGELTDTWGLSLSGGSPSWGQYTISGAEATAAEHPVGVFDTLYDRLRVLAPAGLFQVHMPDWLYVLPAPPPFVKCELRACRGGVTVLGCFFTTGAEVAYETVGVLIGGDCAAVNVFGNRMERAQPVMTTMAAEGPPSPLGCTVWPQENVLGGVPLPARIDLGSEPSGYFESVNGGVVAVPSIFRPDPGALQAVSGLQLPVVDLPQGLRPNLPYGQLFYLDSAVTSDVGLWVHVRYHGWRKLDTVAM